MILVKKMDPTQNKLAQLLRRGVHRLIWQNTPPDRTESKKHWKRSSHSMREFVFALDGTCQYMSNDQIYELTPGTMLLIDSWVPHADGYTKSDNNLLHLWGHFFDDGLQAEILHIGKCGQIFFESTKPLSIPPCFEQTAVERWNRLTSLQPVEDTRAMELMRSPMNLILEEAADSLMEQEKPKSNDALISILQSYIRSKLGKDCSLEQLQKISGISRFYLCRRFHQATGTTIRKFIDRIRLDFTHAALGRGQKQKAIAFELGFSSVSAYWNWLQKHRPDN